MNILQLKWSLIPAIVIGLLVFQEYAASSPVRYNYFNVIAETTENFEGYGYSDVGLVEPFVGFTAATSSFPLVMGTHSTLCGAISDTCLFSSTISNAPRRIYGFTPGTLYMGLDLHKVAPSDQFLIKVTGNSGTSIFTGVESDYIAFADAFGLIEVEFMNQGSTGFMGNYSFDDVITGVSAIPLPAMLPVFAIILVGLGGFVRFKRTSE